MACCAFIAFLVSQLYLLAVAPMRWLRGTPRVAAASAGAWRLGAVAATPGRIPPEEQRDQSATAPRKRARISRRFWLPLVTLGAIELALVVGAGQWFVIGTGRQLLADDLERLAGIQTLSDLKDLCTPGRSRANYSP